MERYCYEPYEGRYHVFDRRRGMSTGGWNSEGMDASKALASCQDADVAERIVRLLNADDFVQRRTMQRAAAQL